MYCSARTRRVVDLEIGEHVQAGRQILDVQLVASRHGDQGALARRGQQGEGIVIAALLRRQQLFDLLQAAALQRPQGQDAARLSTRVVTGEGAPVEQPGDQTSLVEPQPRTPRREIHPANDPRIVGHHPWRSRRPLEELVAIGGDEQRHASPDAKVERQGAHRFRKAPTEGWCWQGRGGKGRPRENRAPRGLAISRGQPLP
jgi:hypothetical protein